MGSFAALWISMSACVPTYMLASSLVGGGMNWRQAVLTIFLGNAIVLVPILLNAHAGTRYGIPFPVLCRASFGTVGANLPALLRALVACGWFGIQSWIGGEAIHKILSVFFPEIAGGASNALGVTLSQFLCFIAFWSLTSSRSKRLAPAVPRMGSQFVGRSNPRASLRSNGLSGRQYVYGRIDVGVDREAAGHAQEHRLALAALR